MSSPTDALDSPVNFLSAMLGANLPDELVLRAYEAQCHRVPVSALAQGAPDSDDVRGGYAAGVVWRGFVQETALPVFLHLYVAAFHDPRLVDVFTPTLIVAQMVDKYAPEPMRSAWMERLKARDGSTPQGMVALTPDPSPGGRGEKDLLLATADVSETSGHDKKWRLSGRIEAVRNLDAELAVIAARVEGAEAPALFLVPRLRADGSLNFHVDQSSVVFDSSEVWLLGEVGDGPELIEEIDGLTLTANCIANVAQAQRLLGDSVDPSADKWKPKIPSCFALSWGAVELLNWTWREVPGFASETALLFRFAVESAIWDTWQLMLVVTHDFASDGVENSSLILERFGQSRRKSAVYALELFRDRRLRSLIASRLIDPDYDVGSDIEVSSNVDLDTLNRASKLFFDAVIFQVNRLDAGRAIAGDSLYA